MEEDKNLKNILEAIKQNKSITCKGKKLKVEAKLTKRNFFDSLNAMGEDKEYFSCFGYSDLSIALYPTLKELKKQAEVSYQDLKNLKWEDIDLNEKTITFPRRCKHKSIETTVKAYSNNK